MPTVITTDKTACLADLFIALAHNKIMSIVEYNESKNDLGYEEIHSYLYKILHQNIKSIKKEHKFHEEYRIIVNEDLEDEIMIEYEEDFMLNY